MKSNFNLRHTIVLVDMWDYVWTSLYGDGDLDFHSSLRGGTRMTYEQLVMERAPLHILYKGFVYKGELPWIDGYGDERGGNKKQSLTFAD